MANHNERCPKCKCRVFTLLERIYGECEPDHKVSIPTGLSAYEGTAIYPTLESVMKKLEQCRGITAQEFVRSEYLRPCDYWVPVTGTEGIIVEFDESQHFTPLRKSALSCYPDDQPMGFDRVCWQKLCDKHNARDNDPYYRDEQRAWYDTLRDLVPPAREFQPTVRIYARDEAWCKLDPCKDEDVEHFKTITGLKGAA